MFFKAPYAIFGTGTNFCIWTMKSGMPNIVKCAGLQSFVLILDSMKALYCGITYRTISLLLFFAFSCVDSHLETFLCSMMWLS